MICIIALVVFGILSLFSASYRPLAREAFDCVFKRMTFRPCNTGFDKKVKGMVTGKIMRKSPRTASFVHKHFEALSWIFIFLTLISIAGIIYGGYNYYLYGNCNGPIKENETPSFCIFDPIGSNQHNQVSSCEENTFGNTPPLIYPNDLAGFKTFGNQNSDITFLMFGCFSCDYTRKASDVYFDIYEDYRDKVKFVYIDFPLSHHKLSFESSEIGTCIYKKDKDSFIEYMRDIFNSKELFTNSNPEYEEDNGLEKLKELSSKYLTREEIDICLNDDDVKQELQKNIELGKSSNIYGTPTFFINGESIVGPRPKKAFTIVLDRNLK